jgi:transposase InsO family protein
MGTDPPESKQVLAFKLGIARSSLYYTPKLPAKDLVLKAQIEGVWLKHPAYGRIRLSIHLGVNHKRISRVMRLFAMQVPRTTKKPKKPADLGQPVALYPNLIKSLVPTGIGQVWAGDFTYLPFQGRFLYLATVMDIYTREIVGWNILTVHTTSLIQGAFLDARVRAGYLPAYHHSDQGSEYKALSYLKEVEALGIQVSMSKKASPWENGYQESFYGKFKLDLGSIQQYQTIGEAVAKIHCQIAYYNTSRIHTSLKMPPVIFRDRHLHQMGENKAPERLKMSV